MTIEDEGCHSSAATAFARRTALRCRPPEVRHFLVIIQRLSSRTRIATFQTTIAFPSRGKSHFALLGPSSISWASVGGHSTIEDSECHLSIRRRLHQQRRTALYLFDITLHRPIPVHHCRSYDQYSRKSSGPIDWSCNS